MTKFQVTFWRRCLFKIPLRLRESLAARFIIPRLGNDPAWFQDAPLAEASEVLMNLMPGDAGHQRIAFTGVYESQLTRIICRLGRERDGRLLDVGANFGYYSLLWGALRPGNRVVAVEPFPANIRALEAGVRRHGMTDRIQVLSCAAMDRDGPVSFQAGPEDQSGWGGVTPQENTGLQVDGRRLDGMLSDDVFRVLKIDCEGADALVLRGLEQLLARRAFEHVFFEENIVRMEHLGIQPGSARSILQSHGYQVTPLTPGADCHDHHAFLPDGDVHASPA